MTEDRVLAQLLRQVEARGMDAVAVRAIVEEASELGAARAMARLGLADEGALTDVMELRELLRAWRDAKGAARRALVEWVVRGCLALLIIGIAWRMGWIARLGA